jgi:hypothetical protein
MNIILGVYLTSKDDQTIRNLGFEDGVATLPDHPYVLRSFEDGWVVGVPLDVTEEDLKGGASLDLNSLQAESLFLERFIKEKAGFIAKSLLHIWSSK